MSYTLRLRALLCVAALLLAVATSLVLAPPKAHASNGCGSSVSIVYLGTTIGQVTKWCDGANVRAYVQSYIPTQTIVAWINAPYEYFGHVYSNSGQTSITSGTVWGIYPACGAISGTSAGGSACTS